MKKIYAVIICISIAAGFGFTKTGTLDNFKPSDSFVMGRAVKNSDGTVTLIASASALFFQFKGSSCTVYLKNVADEDNYNYINIEIDGIYSGRRKVDGKNEKPFVIKAGNQNARHKVVISKSTEASNGTVIITKVDAEHLMDYTPFFAGKIEFIGNSITCGFGNDLEIPCGNGSKWYDQHNAYWSYASRTARALNMEFMISAISGAGIYRNWNSDGPTVPEQYENTFLTTDSSNKWNFASFNPLIVTIALGTNDMSDGDGKQERLPFNKIKFIAAYKNFIKTIYAHYPAAQLVLLNSPMVSGEKGKLLEESIVNIKSDINSELKPPKPVKTFFFKPMTPSGCGFHPSIADHEVMANQLIPFIKTLL